MNSDNIGLEKDITREEFKDWINEHAIMTFSAFDGLYPFGKIFLYPRRGILSPEALRQIPGTTKLEILHYVKNKEDEVIGEILIPPGGFPYVTACKLIQASFAGIRRWYVPKSPPGRSFPVRQREPYPKTPRNDRTLFYVLYDKKNDLYYTYPGSQAVLCLYCHPLAEALWELLNREASAAKISNPFQEYAVVGDDAPRYDELPSSLFYEKNGWIYRRESAVSASQAPADGSDKEAE
jgi:hypothetical protein